MSENIIREDEGDEGVITLNPHEESDGREESTDVSEGSGSPEDREREGFFGRTRRKIMEAIYPSWYTVEGVQGKIEKLKTKLKGMKKAEASLLKVDEKDLAKPIRLKINNLEGVLAKYKARLNSLEGGKRAA